jgi:hypothetical protein
MSSGEESTEGLIYVLTNAAMPGLVKIGITGSDPRSRADQLYTTGVPVPFTVEFAGTVQNARLVERALHNAFRDHRINPNREFFQVEPDQPIEMLKAFAVVDVTSTVSAELEESTSEGERNSRDLLRKRRPPMNFVEMGIAIGETLTFAGDGETTVVVVEERQVELNGERRSLTAATRQLKDLDYDVQPAPHWSYQGRSLRDLYNETYPTNPQ